MALGEIIENGDAMAGVEQLFDADAANIAGTAGDEDVHEERPRPKGFEG